MASLLLVPGLDTRLARALLEARRVEYPTLHAALSRVRELRKTSPQTLAQELLSLGLLDAADLEAALAELMDPDPAGERWELGASPGGLQLLRSLGAGGMGEVYLARDAETGSEVAVKTVPIGQDSEILARFQREAEAQARVDGHPNVVRIHRSGVAGGRAYLVMDAISGGDLSQRLESGPLPPSQAAEIVRQLAAGLSHAHSRGVLHRDLKPSNVLFDEFGTPHLADFGLARIFEAEGLTQTGQILGTPRYMAPEQANGDPQDARTDVYGLGGLLYAALTGQAPFSGGSIFAVLEAVLTAPPPDPRALAPDTPPDLANICLRCLAKSPDDRFQSADQLADALSDSAGGAPEPSRALLGLGAVVALLVVCAALVGRAALDSGAPQGGAAESPTPQASPSASAQPTPVLDAKEIRSRVLAAGRGLPRARLAESFLARGLGPTTWLQERCREPYLRTSAKHAAGVVALHDAQLLLWSGQQHAGEYFLRLLDARTGSVLRSWPEQFVALSPSRSRIALVGGGEVKILETSTWKVIARQPWRLFAGGEFLSEDRLVLHEPEQLFLFDLSANTPPQPFGRPLHDTTLARRVDDSMFLVAQGRKSRVTRLRSLSSETGQIVWSTPLDTFDGKPRCLQVSLNRAWAAFGTSTGRVHLLRTAPAAGQEQIPIRTFSRKPAAGTRPGAWHVDGQAHAGGVHSLTWTPDGRLLTVGARLKAFSLWSVSGELLEENLGASFEPLRVQFSPDGRQFFLVSDRQGLLSGVLSAGFFRELAQARPARMDRPR